MKKWPIYIGVLFTILFFSYSLVLSFPSFLFEYYHKNENIFIYSDKPLSKNINSLSNKILDRVKISNYYDSSEIYRVYISNSSWRWKLVSNRLRDAGGVNYSLFRGNSFIRPSNIDDNRIILPGKNLADAEVRDLIYFISHEIAHGMMAKKLGVLSFTSIPHWLKEGYADYVAKESFDFEKNIEQYIANEWRLTTESGLYVRYHLMLAYLINHKGMSLKKIMANPPNEQDILSELDKFGKDLTQ